MKPLIDHARKPLALSNNAVLQVIKNLPGNREARVQDYQTGSWVQDYQLTACSLILSTPKMWQDGRYFEHYTGQALVIKNVTVVGKSKKESHMRNSYSMCMLHAHNIQHACSTLCMLHVNTGQETFIFACMLPKMQHARSNPAHTMLHAGTR